MCIRDRVNAVNDAPTLAAVVGVSFAEDSSTSITLSGNDIDGDDLTYSVSDGVDITAILDGSTVNFTASQDFNGSEEFTATVTDGEFTSSQTFTVTVNAINDAPTLASVDSVSFDEDGSGTTMLSGSDVDGDDLTYSISGGNDITASLSGSDISFSASENYNGSESFTVSVTDGEYIDCLLYTSPSPRDRTRSRMPSSA